MKYTALRIVSFVCVIGVVAYGLFLISKSRTFQFFGTLISRVHTERKVVALTFDDAPTEYTDEVLHILQENSTPATFYVTGHNIEEYPKETLAIVENGHELGNHTYSHKRMVLKSPSFIEQEVEKTNELIRNTGYRGEITFRPPNGKKLFLLPWYLSQHNIKTILWDVEPDTYVAGNADGIVRYTTNHVQPGSIILLHPFCKKECEADRKALPIIIKELKKEGYEFATVKKLLTFEE